MGTEVPGNREACSVCGDTFATVRMRNLHERVKHYKVPCHRCPHCQDIFGHAQDVSKHILKEHRSSDYPYSCSECTAAFATIVNLRRHQAAHAQKRTISIKCPVCDFRADRIGAVRFHVADKHANWEWNVETFRSVNGLADGPSALTYRELRDRCIGRERVVGPLISQTNE